MACDHQYSLAYGEGFWEEGRSMELGNAAQLNFDVDQIKSHM